MLGGWFGGIVGLVGLVEALVLGCWEDGLLAGRIVGLVGLVYLVSVVCLVTPVALYLTKLRRLYSSSYRSHPCRVSGV